MHHLQTEAHLLVIPYTGTTFINPSHEMRAANTIDRQSVAR